MTRSRATRSTSEAGFTLIEIMVALVLFATILSLAGTGIRLLGASASLGAATIDRNEMLARGIGVLRKDMERIERLTELRGDQPEFLFTGEASRIEMIAIEPPYPSEPGHYVITYTIARAGGTSRLVRSRVASTAFGAPPVSPGESDTVTLIEGPFEMRFSFLERGQEGNSRWTNQWVERRAIPSLVRLEVLGALRGRAVMPPIIVRPRIDAETSCLDEESDVCSATNNGVLQKAAAKKGPAKGKRPGTDEDEDE